MRFHLPFALATLGLSVCLTAACSDEGGTTSTGTPSTSATTGAGGATSSAASTGTGQGGESSATTGAGGATSTTTSGSGGGATTGAGGGTAAGHLLISEVSVTPGPGEFIEIYNPTDAAIDLTDVYLSDNSTYTTLAQGSPWAPITNNAGTDFLAQFPAGTMIGPDAVLVIATDAGFEANYTKCPDFILDSQPLTCAAGTAKAMVAPTNGDLGTAPGAMLSNSREMLVLFTWDGDTTSVLKDIDYVTWGATFEDGTRIDKTAVTGYQPDTDPANQKAAPAPVATQSIERCSAGVETGETDSGGNGVTGHDETSEDMSATFVVQIAPSPGVKNSCL